MTEYYKLIEDTELMDIIDSINVINKDVLQTCHGRYHTMFVVKHIEYVLRKLGYDDYTVELGKIAALLHDIGTLTGKEGHAIKSSEMCEYFLDRTELTDEDKGSITHAIKDHSNGDEINSPFGAALLLIDKVNLCRERVLVKDTDDAWLINLLEIENTKITVKNKRITINYVVTPKFSKKMFDSDWTKGKTVPKKACDYLGCECIFQINGK